MTNHTKPNWSALEYASTNANTHMNDKSNRKNV